MHRTTTLRGPVLYVNLSCQSLPVVLSVTWLSCQSPVNHLSPISLIMSISYLFISVLYLITYSYIYTLERFHVAQGSLETNTHQGPDLAGSPGASQDSKLHMHRAELEVEPVEVAVQPQSPEATESSDYSSDASFVTAVEDSLQPRRPGGICELMASLWVTRGAASAGEGAPNCQSQALTLTEKSTDKPLLLGDGDLGALHPHGSVPPMSDLQLLQALRALGYSPGPVTPFTRGHYLRRLQEAQASPGESLGGGVRSLATLLESFVLGSDSVSPSQLMQGIAQNWQRR